MSKKAGSRTRARAAKRAGASAASGAGGTAEHAFPAGAIYRPIAPPRPGYDPHDEPFADDAERAAVTLKLAKPAPELKFHLPIQRRFLAIVDARAGRLCAEVRRLADADDFERLAPLLVQLRAAAAANEPVARAFVGRSPQIYKALDEILRDPPAPVTRA